MTRFILFFILELFKQAWKCGYNNNNKEENGKDYQRFFDTYSSALCPFNEGERKRSLCRTLDPLPPPV